LGSRLGGDERGEDGVDPVEDCRDRAEVGGEGDCVAEEVLGGEVGGDVGSAEAVDRLFGVAYYEEAAVGDFYVSPVGGVGFGAAGYADG
jgi:hypothetical protein